MRFIQIPIEHLDASRDVRAYFALHRRYCHVYGLNDRDAYEKLENDLKYYSLRGRYSSERSFYSYRFRYISSLVRVNTR